MTSFLNRLITIILLIFTQYTFSQTEIKLDNNITGIISTNTSTTLGFNYVGNNSIEIKKTSIDLSTTYATRYTPSLKENEFIHRTNLGFQKEKWNFFITHQYNYSLIRKISADNWLGVGGGLKRKYNWGKISASYAVIYQNSVYFILEPENLWRHSLRLKTQIDKKFWSLSTEYFYQPGFSNLNDCIIYGTSKISIFNNKPVNFIIQDVINYRNTSDVKIIHNLTIGIGWKYNKKLVKPTN